MNLLDNKIPIATVAGILIFTVTGAFTINSRYAIAADSNMKFSEIQHDIQQDRIQERINNNRLWLQLLDDKVDRAPDAMARDKVLRQIHRIEQSIETDMNKVK